MFFLFSAFTLSSYASIDIGSQYIRIALSSITAEAKMALNNDNKILTPSAVAFKTDKPLDRHLSNEDGYDSIPKYGDDALKYLKYHPNSGTDRVTYFLGRYNLEHSTPPVANTTEMLSILLTKLFMNQQYAGLEGISLCVPRYFTLSQRECLTQAMYLARLPFYGIFDDDQSTIQLYNVKFYHRFLQKKRNVLFVDVGAAGARAYRVEFSTIKATPVAVQTSYIWSEKTGGFSFNSKISKVKKVTESKAQKLLIQSGNSFTKVLKNELNELSNVVKEAITGQIDEVQIIGSASRFNFVQEAIKNAVNSVGYVKNMKNVKNIEILRELPASDSIAIGSLHFLNALLNVSRYKLVELHQSPIYTISVECGGVIEDYCVKNNNCSQYIVLHSTICEKAVFFAEENEVPIGCGNILKQYSLKNISKFDYELNDELNGLFFMDNPTTTVLSAAWCSVPEKTEMMKIINSFERDDEKCETIEIEPSPLTDLQNKEKYEFVQIVLKGDDDRKLLGDLKSKLDNYANIFKNSLKNVQSEQTNDIDCFEMIEKAAKFIEHGTITEIRSLLKKFEEYFKLFGIDEYLKK
ncbi:hypothetical protein TRFO_12598 [Tritrichomonas foetus]|uniref:DnaK protein n=1 Tax=Tritrichomonas foetus TaxID=1144522 RepID=A0A1J4L2D4_9EUKA|nr:hypothetical protein TRFO_12598 [Tritrichomonas foetus]|eukprot:OHT17248.1 hypothetical protein TRFO_12598 [Tritrichomonas foetus]